MAKIFTHVPHPHIAHRSAKGPPKVEDQFSTEGPLARFNTFLALKITAGVGTMWCAYAFAALAVVSLPSAIQLPRRGHDRLVDQSDLPATGPVEHHHRRPERAERRRRRGAQATYEDADAVLHTALEIQEHMEAQDRQISQILEEVQALRS